MPSSLDQAGLRRTVWAVALLNLTCFVAEFAVALAIGSVSLLPDSADFFEDAAVNFMIAAALGWSARRRAQAGMLLAGILLVPAVAFVWALWDKFGAPVPPAPLPLTLTGVAALLVNLLCALLLVRYRHQGGSLTKAAFLSARNDVVGNVAIILAGLLTLGFQSIWPDIIAGLGIAIMNLDAARTVWRAARDEHRLAGI